MRYFGQKSLSSVLYRVTQAGWIVRGAQMDAQGGISLRRRRSPAEDRGAFATDQTACPAMNHPPGFLALATLEGP